MSLWGIELIDLAVRVAAGMMGCGALLAFIRLVRGPSLPDRMMALDLIGLLSVGIVAAYSMAHDARVLLDVATVLALVSFLGTAAFAYYVQRRGRDE